MPPHSPPELRPLPQPVETTTKLYRRFAPEPVETTSRSNRTPIKGRHPEAGGTVVQNSSPSPTETSFINSTTWAKDSQNRGQAQSRVQDPTGLTSPKRLLPQPIENSTSSSKPRRFSPQLLESTKRSRKSGDSGPTILAQDKTDYSSGDQELSLRSLRSNRLLAVPLPPKNSPAVSLDDIQAASESRFCSTVLRKKEPRRHSFRVPDLPSIQSTDDSEGSNESACPSLSTSPSATSDETKNYKNKTRRRKSGSDRPTEYLLSLAVHAAEKQFREQAMAAYPNENLHEPVDHFAIDREDDPEDERRLGRQSKEAPKAFHIDKRDSAIGWEISEMQRHQKSLKKRENNGHATVEPEISAPRLAKEPFQDFSPSTKEFQHTTITLNNNNGGRQIDVEMEKMRTAASPPMAGENLRFPLCRSPQSTRLDSTQYSSGQRPRGSVTSRKHSGLWTSGDSISKQGSIHGLWMGTSAKPVEVNLEPPVAVQTGLLTPAIEREDPFITVSSTCSKHQLPPSPPSSQSDSKVSCLDAILSQEQQIALEFHDAFVTQVYNYLSLGYPSLARKFDAELSKISKVPIEELRHDDSNVNTKGYIGAPERSGTQNAEGKGEIICARWCALRKYVREWARHQGHIWKRDVGSGGEWGQIAIRGSWAI